MSNRTFFLPLGSGLDPQDVYTKDEVNALISDFITNTVDDLVNYYTKSETYTQTEVNTLLGQLAQFRYEVAASTSAVTDPQPNVLYLIGPSATATGDLYEEYVYYNNNWVKIGDTSIDLSDYITTSDLNTALSDYITTSDLTTALADYTPTASLATVATTGAYSDLSGTPNLATVATTGDYTDLTNTPTIPAAQVNSDWNANSGVAEILNKPTLATVATTGNYSDLSGTPSLATVATSGDYSDLTNTPSIPTVNDATVTITQGGVSKGSFTLNQSSNATIDVDAGGASNDWYGTQIQFNALPNKDANTNYWISDQIKYSEINGAPDLSQYATVTEIEDELVGKENNIKFLTPNEYASETKLEGTTYAIEGETVQLTFTLSDNTTVTHNFVIDD